MQRGSQRSDQPSESPQDRLRTVAENRGALEDWVTLGGAVAADDGLASVDAAITAATWGDGDGLTGLLDRVLACGLELRDGMRLGGAHASVYRRLRKLDARPTVHVVCDSCQLVFRPRRKAQVARCDVCNTSRALPLFTPQSHDDGAGYSFRGLFAGTTHVRTCGCCWDTFPAGKSTTLYCSGACKKAAHEGRSRASSLDAEYQAAINEAVERQLIDMLATALPRVRALRMAGEMPSGREVIAETQAQARQRRASERA